jgi:hypothetical protein
MTTSSPKPYVEARISAQQRLARPTRCPKCRRATLTGPDHDRVSYWTTVDAEPIPPELERRAHAAGLSTYDLDLGALCYREPWHFGSTDLPIHVWHTCPGG